MRLPRAYKPPGGASLVMGVGGGGQWRGCGNNTNCRVSDMDRVAGRAGGGRVIIHHPGGEVTNHGTWKAKKSAAPTERSNAKKWTWKTRNACLQTTRLPARWGVGVDHPSPHPSHPPSPWFPGFPFNPGHREPVAHFLDPWGEQAAQGILRRLAALPGRLRTSLGGVAGFDNRQVGGGRTPYATHP